MTFDLEKARKIVGAMSPTPWIVLEDRYGQIDVIRNPNHPMHKEGVIELWGRTSETATPDAIGISYMRSEFPNTLDEIERLRELRSDILTTINRPKTTSDKGLLLYIRDEVDYNIRQATKIGDLEAEIEMLQADAEQHERVIEARSEVIDQQAAKIRELEDAHKRSGAKYAKIINELRSSVYANIPGLKKQWDEILNTPANDKIGPDAEPANIQALQRVMRKQHDHTAEMAELNADHPYPPEAPRSWQITEERVEAIMETIDLLNGDLFRSPYSDVLAVLQAMLTEADHDKP